MGSGPTVAIAAAAAAVVSVDPEGLGGLPPSRTQPCHFLTLAPIRIPLRTAPFPGEYPACLSEPWAGKSPQHGSPGGGLLASRFTVSWVLVWGAGEGFPGLLTCSPHSWTSVPLPEAVRVRGPTWVFSAVKQSAKFLFEETRHVFPYSSQGVMHIEKYLIV